MVTKKKSVGKPMGTLKARIVGIPTRLVAIRTLKGWSQTEAARHIGTSHTSLRALESGKGLGLASELLVRVANAYGTSLDYIYGRSDSAIERFVSTDPAMQSTQVSGVMSGLVQLAMKPDSLRYFDELVSLLAQELPDWPALQNYRSSPATERIAILNQLAQAFTRLARDQTAIKFLSILVMQFAQKSNDTPRYTYSVERDQHALSHTLSAIERMFGHTDSERIPPLTPSRFKVSEATALVKKNVKKKVKKKRKGPPAAKKK